VVVVLTNVIELVLPGNASGSQAANIASAATTTKRTRDFPNGSFSL
jgi:hypothetical protein